MKREAIVPIRITVAVLVLCLLVFPTNAQAETNRTTTRPISDFVSTQGTFCFPDGVGGCIIFVPPIENFIGWDNSDGDPETPELCASIDYAGLAEAYILSQNPAETLQTETTGTIIEHALNDGRAQVEVKLRTENALTWVVETSDLDNGCNFATDPLVFGVRAPEILTGEQPVLCNSSLEFTFINTSPGAPLPDIIQLLVDPAAGQEPLSLSIRCKAHGTLSDGRPAKATIVQKIDLTTFEAFREIIKLKSVGRISAAQLSELSVDIVQPSLFVPYTAR